MATLSKEKSDLWGFSFLQAFGDVLTVAPYLTKKERHSFFPLKESTGTEVYHKPQWHENMHEILVQEHVIGVK